MAVDTPPAAGDAAAPQPEPQPPVATEPTPAAPTPSLAPPETYYYTAPASSTPMRTPSRRRSGVWYASLLLAVVVTLGGLGLLYQDDISWQHQAADLKSRNATLHEQLLTTQTNLTSAQATITELKTAALHPQLGIWNVPQRIDGPDYYLAGGVPDTFTYHLVATSTGPMTVSIVTFEQFAAATDCVHNGSGDTNTCMHRPLAANGIPNTFPNVTSVNFDFHLAEGCANYMVVFTAAKAVTVTPNVSVTYNPAPTFTGDC